MPKRIWFDIEDTGVGGLTKGHHFLESSILQLSFTAEETGSIQDLAAIPAERRMSTWSYRKVWQPLRAKASKRLITLQSEKQILSQFIKQLELNTGAELIGWNIGYTPEVVTREQPLRGFDIAGLMTRSAKYGMEERMQKALKGVKVRDIGQEFGVRMVEGMFGNIGEARLEEMVRAGTLDEDIYKQALGFHKQISIIQNLYGQKDLKDVAKFVSQAGIRFSGWSQDVARQMVVGLYDEAHGKGALSTKLFKDINKGLKPGDDKYISKKLIEGILERGEKAHQADIDVGIARLLTDPIEGLTAETRTQQQWEQIATTWGNLAEENKAVGQIRHSKFAGAKIAEVQAGAWFQSLVAKKDTGGQKKMDQFWARLASEVEDKYGDAPKGKGTWEDILRGLKPDENLVAKYGLVAEKKLSQFGPGALFSRLADSAASRSTIASIAKMTIGNIAEESAKVLGKRGGIGAAALAATAMLGPLQVMGTEADEYKDQMAGYWQHVILGGDLEMNKIPGRDDLYNTIPGLPKSGFAHFNRPWHADFGSGWIPAHGNSLILSDPGFNLEGNFEAMRRAQEAIADEKVNAEEYNSFIRALRFEKDSNLIDYLVNDYTHVGRAMGYLARAIKSTPLPPNEIFGVRIDPTVMDFRREVLQNSDKRAAFEEELAAEQRAAQEKIGRFDRSELHEVDLSTYKEMALEASNMRAINLDDFAVEVEDADTLLLRRKGLFSMFEDPISIRLAGIDAPETAGHEGDPLEALGARIDQAQPYGQRAKAELQNLIDETENLQLLVETEPSSYGRYMGVVFGDTMGAEFDDINSWGDFGKGEQVNLNMELIRRGAVANLPFGPQQGDLINRHRAAEAEEEAADHNLGMWQYTRFKAHRHMSELLKNSITFNTFTQRQKLADNLDLAAYASYLQSMGSTRRDLKRSDKDLLKNMGGTLRRHGFAGRKRPAYMKGYRKSGRTYTKFAPPDAVDYGTRKTFTNKIPLNRPWPKADDNFHNTIEAFGHGGQAYSGRRRTDFGSGWDGNKAEAKLHPFEDSPNIKDTFTRIAAKQQPSPANGRSKDNIVRALAVEDISVYNTNNRKGVNTTLTELTAQVQGEKVKKGNLALETKKFSWDSDPSRSSRKTSAPTKVDNSRNTNNIKDENYISKDRQLEAIAIRNKRSLKFRNSHQYAIRSIEENRRYPGRRSKRTTGATILS